MAQAVVLYVHMHAYFLLAFEMSTGNTFDSYEEYMQYRMKGRHKYGVNSSAPMEEKLQCSECMHVVHVQISDPRVYVTHSTPQPKFCPPSHPKKGKEAGHGGTARAPEFKVIFSQFVTTLADAEKLMRVYDNCAYGFSKSHTLKNAEHPTIIYVCRRKGCRCSVRAELVEHPESCEVHILSKGGSPPPQEVKPKSKRAFPQEVIDVIIKMRMGDGVTAPHTSNIVVTQRVLQLFPSLKERFPGFDSVVVSNLYNKYRSTAPTRRVILDLVEDLKREGAEILAFLGDLVQNKEPNSG